MEDPTVIVEGIAQSSSDAYEKKGIVYSVAFAGAEIAQIILTQRLNKGEFYKKQNY